MPSRTIPILILTLLSLSDDLGTRKSESVVTYKAVDESFKQDSTVNPPSMMPSFSSLLSKLINI